MALTAPHRIECRSGPDDACCGVLPFPGTWLARVCRNRCLRDVHSLKQLLSKVVEFQNPGKRCKTPKRRNRTELSRHSSELVHIKV
jgi:hypothetical protein